MKNLFLFCLLIYTIPLTVIGQAEQSSAYIEKIRIPGYLIIEGHHETIRKGSDIPRKFLFIPIERFKEESFSTVYQRECQPKHNDLFIPISFMEQVSMAGINVFLRRSLNSSLQLKREATISDAFEDYLKQSVFYKLKGTNKELHITFIDVVWAKFQVPFKYADSSYIEGYNMTRLKKLDDAAAHYEYYYLLETMSFAPVVFINDKSLVKVNK